MSLKIEIPSQTEPMKDGSGFWFTNGQGAVIKVRRNGNCVEIIGPDDTKAVARPSLNFPNRCLAWVSYER